MDNGSSLKIKITLGGGTGGGKDRKKSGGGEGGEMKVGGKRKY